MRNFDAHDEEKRGPGIDEKMAYRIYLGRMRGRRRKSAFKMQIIKFMKPNLGIYFTDVKTCWVKTGVEIEGLEHMEYLPIMEYKNKSISLENITSFDVNKSIQRSLTKALDRHGLGLYLYAGEDLPEIEIEKSGWPRRPSCAQSI